MNIDKKVACHNWFLMTEGNGYALAAFRDEKRKIGFFKSKKLISFDGSFAKDENGTIYFLYGAHPRWTDYILEMGLTLDRIKI